MGLLQEIADMVGSDRVRQLADGEGEFDDHRSPDHLTLQELLKKVDPEELQAILVKTTRKIDPREYSDHVTPGAQNTNPLGDLKGGGLATIATVLLNQLKKASDGTADVQRIPDVRTTDPKDMDADDVAAVARYTQQNHPEAFGKAAAQIGQEQPKLLNSFMGKAAMAVAAAALASHFIKLDRKTPK